ncbi:MAG: hypothetical protein WCT36_04995 [Candidatus Gracilibacteria bacterium]|jgi:hypothetical protein
MKTFPTIENPRTQAYLNTPFKDQRFETGRQTKSVLSAAGLPERVLRRFAENGLVLDPLGKLLDSIAIELERLRGLKREEILMKVFGKMAEVDLVKNHPLVPFFDNFKNWSAKDGNGTYLLSDDEIDRAKVAILEYLHLDALMTVESVALICEETGNAVEDGRLKLLIGKPFIYTSGEEKAYFMREQAFPSVVQYLKIDLDLSGDENAQILVGEAIETTLPDLNAFFDMLKSIDLGSGGKLFLLTASAIDENGKGTCVIESNGDYRAYKWIGREIREVSIKKLPSRRNGMIELEIDGEFMQKAIAGFPVKVTLSGELTIFPMQV